MKRVYVLTRNVASRLGKGSNLYCRRCGFVLKIGNVCMHHAKLYMVTLTIDSHLLHLRDHLREA
jgi:hypothetical protein